MKALPGRGVPIDQLADPDINEMAALRELPPLIKGYLRLGAYICEDAVIDWQFGTTDVFIVLPVERINTRYINYYGEDASRHAAERQSLRCIRTRSSQRPNLKPTSGMRPVSTKPCRQVEPDRGLVVRGDAGDHHMLAERARALDQRHDQGRGDAAAARCLGDIDRVLDGEAVAVEGAEIAERAVGDDRAVLLADEHRDSRAGRAHRARPGDCRGRPWCRSRSRSCA